MTRFSPHAESTVTYGGLTNNEPFRLLYPMTLIEPTTEKNTPVTRLKLFERVLCQSWFDPELPELAEDLLRTC